jgi:hypothetical protein
LHHADYREDVYTLALMLQNVMVDVASQYEHNGLVNNHVKTMYSYACEWMDRITQKLHVISNFLKDVALPSRVGYTYVMHAPKFTKLKRFISFEEALANELLVKVPINYKAFSHLAPIRICTVLQSYSSCSGMSYYRELF